jgi:hypothetical protein
MASSVAAPEAPRPHAADPTWRRLRARWPLAVLALAMVAAAGLLLYLTRGFTFYYDEWNFLINRQEFTADALLRPHNEHNVMVAVLLFKGLWELVGLDHYLAFRVLVVALHLLCGGLLYVYARRRVGPVLALAPAVIVLFLGTAWEIILWPFEVQFLIPIAAGLGAFMLLERRELRADLWASGLLVLALAGGSLGIPVLLGAGVDILFRPDRFRRLARVVALPAALYVAWLREYDPFRHRFGTYESVPGFVFEQLGSALAAVAGFQYHSVRTPALVAAGLLIVVLAERFARGKVDRGRLAAVVAMAVAYWAALALYRPWVADQEASRFLYGGAVLVLLALLEVARGRRPGPRALAVVGVLVLLSAASNLDDLRDGASRVRAYSNYVEPGLGALELTRGHVRADFQPEPARAPDIVAGRYFRAVDRWGSPADRPREILTRAPGPRAAADIVLVEALRLELRPGRLPARPGPLPRVDAAVNGTARAAGGCLRFTPSGPGALEVRLPAGGAALAAKGPVDVQLRRFGDSFQADQSAPQLDLFGGNRQAFGRGVLRARTLRLESGRPGVLRIPADAAPTPWHARAVSTTPLTVCGLPPR